MRFVLLIMTQIPPTGATSSRVRGIQRGIARCGQCPPNLARFSSFTGLQKHLASGAHHRPPAYGEGSNDASNPVEQGRQQRNPHRADTRNPREQGSPPVDLKQWAQSIRGTLSQCRPSTFSVAMLEEIDNNLQNIQSSFVRLSHGSPC